MDLPMSSKEVIVDVRNVSKRYEIYNTPRDRLKQLILPRLHQMFNRAGIVLKLAKPLAPPVYFHEFWALKDISFQVRRGETFGIIGRNGSGKSTLLQIIAGTSTPTIGEVNVHGRIAALLELGSGFNPEFTGRENVYLNGRILGLTQKEITDRYDQIVDFADIGEFIDQPVKTYSSGMFVRLAFAVQAHIDASVFIIDEALAVGDVFFQQKCFKRLREMLNTGTSLLFVSHDLAAVQNLCSRAMLLADGNCSYLGPSDEAASRYFSLGCTTVTAPASNAKRTRQFPNSNRETVLRHNFLGRARSIHGSGGVEMVAAAFRNAHGGVDMRARVGDTIEILLLMQALRPSTSLSCGMHLFDRFNNLVFAAGTRQLRIWMPPISAGEERLACFRLTLDVCPGEYTFSIGCSEASPEGANLGHILKRAEGIGPLTVETDGNTLWPFYGVARLPLSITIQTADLLTET